MPLSLLQGLPQSQRLAYLGHRLHLAASFCKWTRQDTKPWPLWALPQQCSLLNPQSIVLRFHYGCLSALQFLAWCSFLMSHSHVGTSNKHHAPQTASAFGGCNLWEIASRKIRETVTVLIYILFQVLMISGNSSGSGYLHYISDIWSLHSHWSLSELNCKSKDSYETRKFIYRSLLINLFIHSLIHLFIHSSKHILLPILY